MSRSLRFDMVDVFGSDGFDGNPLAVVHDAGELTTAQMQRIATWTNLSETTFLVPPSPGHGDVDYQVRIFTTEHELPFAGHPTLGSAHAWKQAGGRPARPGRIVQECGLGLVQISDEGTLAFAAPDLLDSGPPPDDVVARTIAILGVDPDAVVAIERIDNGPPWVGVIVDDTETLGRLRPKPVDEQTCDIAVASIGSDIDGVDVEIRCFFGTDVAEDPVTGSANAGFAQWFARSGAVDLPYVAAQGNYMGRNGRVRVDRAADGTIWIGGSVRTVVTGEMGI